MHHSAMFIRRRLGRLALGAALLTLAVALARAGDVNAQAIPYEPRNPAADIQSRPTALSVIIPKEKFAPGERFQACFTFPSPAGITVFQQFETNPQIRLMNAYFGDGRTRDCVNVVAGSTDRNCTNDVAGLDTIPCVAGSSGTECVRLAVLTELGHAAFGGNRVVLVERAQACYDVG